MTFEHFEEAMAEINDVHIRRPNGRDSGPVEHVLVRFGDAHWLSVTQENHTVIVRLASGDLQVGLQADGPMCSFVQAINLIRLHLPVAGSGRAGRGPRGLSDYDRPLRDLR